MSENSTKFIVRSQDQNAAELEVEATLFQGKVCLAFKTARTASNSRLMDELLKLHPDGDPSIKDVGLTGTKLMNTRFSQVKDMLEFLGRIGYKCQSVDPLSGSVQKIRFVGSK